MATGTCHQKCSLEVNRLRITMAVLEHVYILIFRVLMSSEEKVLKPKNIIVLYHLDQ